MSTFFGNFEKNLYEKRERKDKMIRGIWIYYIYNIPQMPRMEKKRSNLRY